MILPGTADCCSGRLQQSPYCNSDCNSRSRHEAGRASCLDAPTVALLQSIPGIERMHSNRESAATGYHSEIRFYCDSRNQPDSGTNWIARSLPPESTAIVQQSNSAGTNVCLLQARRRLQQSLLQ